MERRAHTEVELEDREMAGLVLELGALRKEAVDQAQELEASRLWQGRQMESRGKLCVLPREQ